MDPVRGHDETVVLSGSFHLSIPGSLAGFPLVSRGSGGKCGGTTGEREREREGGREEVREGGREEVEEGGRK